MSFFQPQAAPGAGQNPAGGVGPVPTSSPSAPSGFATFGQQLKKYLPQIAMGTQAAGTLASGFGQANAMRANAGSYTAEAGIASAQGYAQEAEQRRSNAMTLGRETAAVGQSGTGYGGSSGRAVSQSAVNMELDALSTRYKAQMQRWAFLTQAGNLRTEAGIAQTGGFLKAGAALLRGYAGNYTAGFGV